MEQQKPFKTIEVVDSRTSQVCKVACMSCIRGHRTTSCGIPVCRTKVFWTVKRPGRPSNSCTCRYGATGGCKCVVARSACPHKSKKGEKRSGECRCDEQGRYCCLIEPEHWSALLSLRKPTVDFFPSREALEAKQMASDQMSLPQTPAYASMTSPSLVESVPGTPASQNGIPPLHIMPNNYDGYHQPQTGLTPRFGMMGIGAPMGSTGYNTSRDVLVWNGTTPVAPREPNRQHSLFEASQANESSCCQQPRSTVPSPVPSQVNTPYAPDSETSARPREATSSIVDMSQLSPPPPAFDFNRLQADYLNYQFPSAICQNCGLSGCTCRNCPPVFQNFGTTSWAQCCGRKHARDAPSISAPQKVARTATYEPLPNIVPSSQPDHALPPPAPHPEKEPFQTRDSGFAADFQDSQLSHGNVSLDLDPFQLDHDLLLPDGTELDISEFLMSDLDQSNQAVASNGVTGGHEDEGGGSGGCCCGGS